jgi:ribosomal protein S18 acetylase RimI-like enzyme
MPLEVRTLDYHDAQDGAHLIHLLNIYALDPMGGGSPLAERTKANLVKDLSEQASAFSLIAFVDGEPAGLANCFWGYSTFAARPLINIHDIIVDASFRGQGVAKALFASIEQIAVNKGACKVTLEVLSGNHPAKALYTSLGYGDYALDPEHGTALFWQKGFGA